MATDIYSQHDAAFNRVSAFVIVKGGERVATVALKFPADGAGRLYAYVHWIGNEMARGMAGGYGYDKRTAAVGYDKRTAAVGDAARKFMAAEVKAAKEIGEGPRPDRDALKNSFFDAINHHGGTDWNRRLEDAGFTVFQAV